jgi:hypothetical protein
VGTRLTLLEVGTRPNRAWTTGDESPQRLDHRGSEAPPSSRSQAPDSTGRHTLWGAFVTGAVRRFPAGPLVPPGSRDRRSRSVPPGILRPIMQVPVVTRSRIAGLEPGGRSTPHASPTAADRTASRFSLSLEHDSVPVGSRSRPARVPESASGRVTSVACAFTENSARARNACEGESRSRARFEAGEDRGAVAVADAVRFLALRLVAVAVAGAVAVQSWSRWRVRWLCSRGRGGGGSLRCCRGRLVGALAIVALLVLSRSVVW